MDSEKRIAYQGGITRSPSDFVCNEGELAECIGLTSDGAELKVMGPLAVKNPLATIEKKLVFVHKLGDGTENYIYEGTYNGAPYLFNGSTKIDDTSHTSEPIKSISAIGKTIIVSFNGRLCYLLYTGSGYKNIGDIPTPKVRFRMGMDQSIDQERYERGYSLVETTGSPAGIIGYVGDDQSNPGLFFIKDDDEGILTKYNDLVIGLYGKNKKTIKEKKGFCEPFCARVALEMADGTYTHMTNPVVLLPSITRNSHAQNKHGEIKLRTRYSLLYCWLDGDYSDWSDIVKDVVVFITDGVRIYDLTVDQPYHGTDAQPNARFLTEARYNVADDYLTDGVAYNTEDVNDQRNKLRKTTVGPVPPDGPQGNRRQFVLKERPVSEITEDVASLSTYFRLCSLGLVGTHDFVCLSDKIGEHTLDTLTTRERLKYLDYYSNFPLKADYLYAYNSRLNMAGVERGFFGGFEDFLPYDNEDFAQYTAYVTIKTSSGDRIIVHEYEHTTKQMQGLYFFYPDPRASHVLIKKVLNNTTTWVCNQDLKEHPGLNGAYFLRELLPNEEAADTAPSSVPTANNTPEKLLNYLLVSEVNNPWAFLAHGYNKVGTGKVVGLATVTMALSQDNFGNTDLIAFTDEGIWGLTVAKEGFYLDAHPVTRDVCTHPSSITQTDFAVFFVSKQGLMMITAGGVSCVSERMNGKTFDTAGTPLDSRGLPAAAGSLANDIDACSESNPFNKFLTTGTLHIAYDYIDSRLLLTNSGKDYCWVYSLKDKTFSKMVLPSRIDNVVNAYPDYLLQNTATTGGNQWKLYTLYGKTHEDEVSTRQRGFLCTRPIKLGGVLTVASLRELRNVGVWDEGTFAVVSSLPTSPSDGDVICPSADIVVGTTPDTVTYHAGCYYEYKLSTTSWVPYNGCSWVKTMILVSDNLRDWHELTSRFGLCAKYFRIALFVNMLPTERLSGTVLVEQERRRR